MSRWCGKKISVEIFGESHGGEIGVRASGLPIVEIDEEKLFEFTSRRRASGGVFSTTRKEADAPIFLKGYDNGVIGGDFEAIIKNENVKSGDYSSLYGKPRPSHADYCAYVKDGTLDFSGGGRFSGRLTAPLVLLGGILKQFLESKGIRIYSYLSRVGKAEGKSYTSGVTEEELQLKREFPALCGADEMLKEIAAARRSGNSVGAVADCVIKGVPAGIGNDYFSGLEGKIAALVYAIPAVKGVEFGAGFALGKMTGSEANDFFAYENGKVVTLSNNSGGILGGISSGEDITFRAAIKPTPSISQEQKTVDLVRKENAVIKIAGRHDACVAVRALPAIESAAAIAIADEILSEENKK